MTGNSSIDLSLANVWRSWRAFRAGKKPSRAIYEFEANLEQNLIKLYKDLTHTHTHTPINIAATHTK